MTPQDYLDKVDAIVATIAPARVKASVEIGRGTAGGSIIIRLFQLPNYGIIATGADPDPDKALQLFAESCAIVAERIKQEDADRMAIDLIRAANSKDGTAAEILISMGWPAQSLIDLGDAARGRAAEICANYLATLAPAIAHPAESDNA